MSLSFSSRFIPYGLLLTVILLIYSNSLDCSWQFDDFTNITENQALHLRDLSLGSIKSCLLAEPARTQSVYRPFSCFTFALNHYFGGLDVFGYHLVNVVIHIAASFFLFLVIYHTLNLPSISGQYASQSYSIALLAATFWAVHPIQVQAVTYIVQRMTSLAGMFYILSMYFYLQMRLTTARKKRALLMVSCVLAFLMSFGSKENAILLPLSLVLYEAFFIQLSPFQFLRRNAWIIAAAGVGIIMAGSLFLYLKTGSFSAFWGDYSARPFSMSERLLTEPRVIFLYLSLLVYPIPERFGIVHSVSVSTSLLDPPSSLLSILAVAAMIGVSIAFAKKYRLIAFAVFFFFLNHLVESSIFPLELVFEHRNYIPSMFFFLPFAAGISMAVHSPFFGKPMRILFAAFAVLLIIGFAHSTYFRNFAWKSPLSLWKDALAKAPDHVRVHQYLGVYYQESRQWDKAIFHLERALKSAAMHKKNEAHFTLYQLGKLYGDLGDREKAKYWYQKSISVDPDFSPALTNLACLYDEEGNREAADRYMMQAFKTDPGNDPVTHLNRGIYLIRKRMSDEAIPHLEVGVKQEDLMSKALFYLGIAYKQKGQYGRAALHLYKCTQMDPRNITPRLHLAEIHFLRGHDLKAEEEFRHVAHMITRDNQVFRSLRDLLHKEDEPGISLEWEILGPPLVQALEVNWDAIKLLSDEIKKNMVKR